MEPTASKPAPKLAGGSHRRQPGDTTAAPAAGSPVPAATTPVATTTHAPTTATAGSPSAARKGGPIRPNFDVTKVVEQKDPWVEEELKKWEEERKQVGVAFGKQVAQPSANATINPALAKLKGDREKRRTIGVATPHSHFFAELEQVRKQAKEEEGKKAAGAAAAGPAGAAPVAGADANRVKLGEARKGSAPLPPAPPAAPPVDKALIHSPPNYNPAADPSRPAPQVIFPAVQKLRPSELFEADGSVKLQLLRDHLVREGRLAVESATQILARASELMRAEPNCLDLTAPCLVFGDLHGQFYDMLNMIDKAGPVTSYKYLFLGDYVDRGTFGCECVLYLMALKINYPKSVYLLRGNHESRLLAEHFNFKAEAVYKYNEDIYNKIQECFDTLPLAAVLTGTIGRFFCVHGGLSPEAPTIKEINEVDRFREPPEKGPFCDLLWSDPAEESAAIGLTALQLARWHAKTFEPNPTRGCSYFYGYGAVKEFLTKNSFSCIVRAHEVQKQGYKLHKFKKFDLKQPPVITVFSAPNYCDMYENWAAWLVFEDTSYTFGQVAWVDHPYYLPNFSNAVAFTFPFVVENFMKVLADVLTAIGQIGFEKDQAAAASQDEFQMAEEVTQNRVRAMGRIAIMMKKLRLEREANIKATALGAGGDKYDLALRMDLSNEKRPADARKRFQTM